MNKFMYMGMLVFCLSLGAGKVVISSSESPDFRLQKLQENLERLEAHIYGSSTLDRTTDVQPTGGTGDGHGGDMTPKILPEHKKNAQLASKFDEVLAENADLKGKIEELSHELQAQQVKMTTLTAKVDKQLLEIQALVARQLTPVASPAAAPSSELFSEDESMENVDGPPISDAPIGSPTIHNTSPDFEPLPPVKTPVKKDVITPVVIKAKTLSPDEKLIQDLKKMSSEQAYKKAKSFILEGKDKQAEIALKTFVETFPDDARIGSAYYFLGELYYVQKKYDAALGTFAEGYRQRPEDAKAPEYLLKMAQILEVQKKNKEACITLSQLLKEYPRADGQIKKTAKDLKSKLKCAGAGLKSK